MKVPELKPEKLSELQKWFDRITIVAERAEPLAFANVDVNVARDELSRMQFMVEHGLAMKTEALKNWHFEYQPETRFIQATHPMGGKFSVVRVEPMPMSGLNPDDIGNAVADMLNGKEMP